MATTVGRDPVARGEYKRWCYSNPDNSRAEKRPCHWCGATPQRLYGYVWWYDDTPEPQQGCGHWFCNLTCFRADHT